MKILHVISSLEVGGAQRLLSDLLPLVAKENLVSLLVFKNTDTIFEQYIKEKGIIINSLNVNCIYNPWIFVRLFFIVRKFDIIHIHLFPSLYWGALVQKFTRCRFFYTEHSTSNKRRNKKYLRFIEQKVYRSYDKIISISNQTEINLLQWLDLNKISKFIVVENGIDLQKFRKSYESILPKTSINLLMISRFTKAKDHSTIISAMELLRDDIHLYLVGDGETRNVNESLVKEKHLESRVHFLGNRNDSPQLISSCLIGIQSSHWEGFGLTAVEFMAAGKPIVASDVEGLRQVVENAGLLFKHGDRYDFVYKINLLLNSEDYYHKISCKCFQRSKLYDINITAMKYNMLYSNK